MIQANRVFLSSIPMIVTMLANNYMNFDRDNFFMTRQDLPVNYDFIIVGGGTAGLVLANRLSKNFSVLVLEAGGHPPPLVGVPALIAQINAVPEINFMYQSAPQINAGRDNGGRVPVSAGKMLGGSSSHNYMAWEHGHAMDYDRWAYLSKDENWKYENLLRYFRQIERMRSSLTFNDQNPYDGRFEVGAQSFLALAQDLWFEAGREMGYNVRHPRRPQSVGFNPIVYSTAGGLRASSYVLYLKPILKDFWRQLYIHKYSYVSKVIIEEHRAIGVEYERHGVRQCAFATKEVILSAGAFISPIILFNSGIGPKDQVRAANAEHHVMNLPVGHNLQDHTLLPVTPIFVDDPSLTWSLERNLSKRDVDLFYKGKGPLTTSFHGSEAFVRSETLNKYGFSQINEWPDLQIVFNPTALAPSSWTCLISNGQPTSRGVLTVNGSATSMADNHLPILNYNYFQTDHDIDVTITGINFCLRVLEETDAFHRVGARLSFEPVEQCRMYPFRSRDYWICYIRYRVGTYFHTSGTCRMGHGQYDPLAVVDSKLRVIGMRGLRVVDASIMPFVTNANIMAPTLVIAEKAADDILYEYSHSGHSRMF